jgi:ribA/ribD-fused uncharacterized protein
MEPYWNTVRTQQVKGRAVRICSHMDLPKDQQNVEVYTYCSIIPDEAVMAQAIDKTLEHNDAYSAEEARALGVPIPDAIDSSKEIPLDLFEKVDEVAPGAVEEVKSDVGAILFSTRVDNQYRALSNFAPTPITIGGKLYPTVEHFFQSKKFPEGSQEAENIRVAPTPLKAQQLGRQNPEKMVANWDTEKEGVMLTGLTAKFTNNLAAKAFLQSTGDRPLIEDSVDAYWGKGVTGKGKNRMGKLLEQVRTELKEYVPPPIVVETSPAANIKEDYFEGNCQYGPNRSWRLGPHGPEHAERNLGGKNSIISNYYAAWKSKTPHILTDSDIEGLGVTRDMLRKLAQGHRNVELPDTATVDRLIDEWRIEHPENIRGGYKRRTTRKKSRKN